MYIGTDGILHAEWWQKAVAPMASLSPVDDGLWHHAVLTATGDIQALYIDGKLQATLTGTVYLSGGLSASGSPNLNFGAGYLGSYWPDEAHYLQNGNTGYLDYFNGELADTTLSYFPTTTYEVQASQKSGYCLDNRGSNAISGNPIQIYSCNHTGAQQWEPVPSLDGIPGQYQLQNSNGMCLDDPNDTTTSGTKVQLWTWLGNPNQERTATPVNGSYTWYVNANGMCLDNTNNSKTNGTQVQILACSATAVGEQWYGPSPTS